MTHPHRLLPFCLVFLTLAASGPAQDARPEDDGEKRVQYQLVLPDEKTPENVKPEEHNPFESESEALNRQSTGDTEENRVRDKLLKLPVVGVNREADGRMRVLLGDIILETGCKVPSVLPDQLVELKVKNITAEYIELAWQEKRFTGLPPKIMTIPINIAPQVRYRMLGQLAVDAKNGSSREPNATMVLPLRDIATGSSLATASPAVVPPPVAASAGPAPATSPATAPASVAASAGPAPATSPATAPTPAAASAGPPTPPRAKLVADDPQPFSPPRVLNEPATPPVPTLAQTPAPEVVAPKPAEPQPPPAAPPPASPAVESVVRMLFGNSTPAPK